MRTKRCPIPQQAKKSTDDKSSNGLCGLEDAVVVVVVVIADDDDDDDDDLTLSEEEEAKSESALGTLSFVVRSDAQVWSDKAR
jgi:hypothetical protein